MKYITIIFFSVLMISCSSARKAKKTTTPVDVSTNNTTPAAAETAETVIAKMNKIDFSTFSGKVDVDYADGKNNRSVNVKLNMKKDEAIWLSAGLLGIEGVRVFITKDSVKILNKLNKEYIATSLGYVQEKIGLPVDFATLQDLLIGNAVFVNANNSTLEKSTSAYTITSQDDHFKNLLTLLLPGYLPSVSQLTDVDASKNRSAQLQYSNYKNVDGKNFPASRNIKVNYKNNVQVNMDFGSYIFNGDVSMPFSVPGNYKRVTPK